MNSKRSVVVTVGVFDGVHAGHRFLISAAQKIAQAKNAQLIAASFDPHPVSILRPDKFQGLITLPDFRSVLLKQAGAQKVEFIKFNQTVAQMSPDEFIEKIVLGNLNANTVVVGENFRFGVNASGDVSTLATLATKFGFELEVIKLVGDQQTWSSTRIRNNLLTGDVKAARQILGRPHRLTGEVVHGDHRGRELGYPTANVEVFGNLIIPADGVYSALVTTDSEVLPAAVSIGTNPTFDDVLNRRVEAYVLDRTDLDLYGKQISVDFLDFVRSMDKFSDVESLLAQMARDVENTRLQVTDFLDSPSH